MKDINLLPEEMMKHNKSRFRKQEISIVIIFLLFMIVPLVILILLNYMTEKENINVSQEIYELEEVREEKEILETMKKEITFKEQVASEIEASNTNYYLIMDQLEKLVPQGIQFTEQTGEAGRMTIIGTANEGQDVAEFAENLRQLPSARNIWIESTKYMDLTQFQISFIFTDEEDLDEAK